jgi:hypothetical protein
MAFVIAASYPSTGHEEGSVSVARRSSPGTIGTPLADLKY